MLVELRRILGMMRFVRILVRESYEIKLWDSNGSLGTIKFMIDI